MPNNETTTSFKVDISELQRGMKEASRQIRLANSEFKAATAGMDKWSDSADGLSAKIKQLNSIVDAQKSKLQILSRQYADVVGEQGENSAAAQELLIQINNQRAAIARTESELSRYQSALNEMEEAQRNSADAIDDLGESMDDANENTRDYADSNENLKDSFNKLKTVAVAALAAIGAAVVSGLGKALSFSDEATKALNGFQASTGATAEEMTEFDSVMKNIYRGNYGESFEDIANSMSEIKQMSGDMGADELEKMTTKALVLRDTFDFEVGESMRGVNSLMDQFGITSDEAFDLLAQGAQKGLNQNGDLLDVINEYSVQFQHAGYSAEDMFNMLANGVETGTWSVDKLGDAVKEFNIRMSDGSAQEAVEALGFSWDAVSKAWSAGGDEAKDVFNMLINELDGMENTTEGYGIGVGLLGTMFEDLGFDAVYALSQTEGEISKTKNALEEIDAVKYNSVGEALTGLGRSIQTDILMPIGDKLLPVMGDLVAKFNEWLSDPATQEAIQDLSDDISSFVDDSLSHIADFIKWFLENKDLVIAGIAGIASGFVAWNVVTMIQGVVKAIKAFQLANEGATIAQWALNTAMNANPIGLIIAAIVGLVTAFVVLWNKSEAFRNFWIGLWENIKSIAQTVWEAISGFFVSAWEKIQEIWDTVQPYFQAIWDGIVVGVKVVLAALLLPFVAAWEGIKAAWEVVGPYFEALWETIKSAFSAVADVLGGFFRSAWEIIKGIWDAVKPYFEAIWNAIKAIFSVVVTVLGGFFSGAWDAIKKVWNGAKTFFSGIWNGIKKVFSSVKKWFGDTFGDAWEAIKDKFKTWGEFWSGLWTKIKDKFSDIGSNIGGAISDTIKSGLNGVLDMIESILNKGIGLINNAIDLANLLPGVDVGHVPELSLPRLEKGGVLKKGQIGLLEGNGAEAVVPLDKNKKWIRKTAQDMNKELRAQKNFNSSNSNVTNNYNFNQTNNSPKALSRLDIYRQSKNLIYSI